MQEYEWDHNKWGEWLPMEYVAKLDLIVQIDVPHTLRGVFLGVTKVAAMIVNMGPSESSGGAAAGPCQLVYDMSNQGGETWNTITVPLETVLDAVDRLNGGKDSDKNRRDARWALSWVYTPNHHSWAAAAPVGRIIPEPPS